MGDVSVLDRPLYGIQVASMYLRVPPPTLEYWLEGGVRDGIRYEPVVRETATGSRDLTWGEFVECWYVRQYRRSHGVRMADVRGLISRLRSELGVKYPLAHKKAFVAAGRKLAAKVQIEAGLSQRVWLVVTEPDGQLGLSTIAESFLSEVDFEGSATATRISPDGRDSPVVIQPDVAFGAPHVRGIRTENLAELVEAGDELEVVAADFNLEADELRAALAYEWSQPQGRAAA